MARAFEVNLIWNEKAINVRGTAHAPEPDVGIFSYTIEEMVVTDKGTGQEMSLTEEQFRDLEDRTEIQEAIERRHYGLD